MKQNHKVNNNTLSAWNKLYAAKRFERDNKWLFPIIDGLLIKADTVLEVGCGMGTFLHKIAKRNPSKKFIGTDYSEIAIERSVRNRRPNLKFLAKNAEESPILSIKFDLVMCIETLEHVNDPEKIVINMTECCNKGGKILITVPKPGSYLDTNSLNWHYWTLYPDDFVKWLGTGIKVKFPDKNHMVVTAEV